MQTTSKLSNTTGTRKLVELTGALGTARRSYQVAEGQSPCVYVCVCASPGVLFTSRFQFGGGGRFQFKSLQCRLRYCASHYYPGTETLAIGHSWASEYQGCASLVITTGWWWVQHGNQALLSRILSNSMPQMRQGRMDRLFARLC